MQVTNNSFSVAGQREAPAKTPVHSGMMLGMEIRYFESLRVFHIARATDKDAAADRERESESTAE